MFLSLIIKVLVIPIGIILSITGVQVTLNVFAEFVGGYIYSVSRFGRRRVGIRPHLLTFLSLSNLDLVDDLG